MDILMTLFTTKLASIKKPAKRSTSKLGTQNLQKTQLPLGDYQHFEYFEDKKIEVEFEVE